MEHALAPYTTDARQAAVARGRAGTGALRMLDGSVASQTSSEWHFGVAEYWDAPFVDLLAAVEDVEHHHKVHALAIPTQSQ